MPSPFRLLFRLIKWLFLFVVVVVAVLMLWGDRLLIAPDPTPAHVDAVVVLQGSVVAEKVRIAGAVNLLQRGVTDRALISVPKESYWGQAIPPVARAYLEKNYGADLAARVDFCEPSAQVDSTGEEALAAMDCIHEHAWHSVVVVTSDYHTRRARILWRRAAADRDPGLQISVQSVDDPEFQKPWWRHRQSAKIWLAESLKLVWAIFGR